MSFSASNLGTNYVTYSMNPDRSGQWATYLMELALQNGHDRMQYNGEVNTKTGIVDRKPIPANKISRPNVKTPNVETELSAMKKRHYNPRYFMSGTG
jgi:hypothetical protein